MGLKNLPNIIPNPIHALAGKDKKCGNWWDINKKNNVTKKIIIPKNISLLIASNTAMQMHAKEISLPKFLFKLSIKKKVFIYLIKVCCYL